MEFRLIEKVIILENRVKELKTHIKKNGYTSESRNKSIFKNIRESIKDLETHLEEFI